MKKARDVHGQVMRALTDRVRSGAFTPGAPLAIADLATEFRASATPVREVLCRLAGEGLVVEVRGRGYAYPPADPRSLRELYELHEAHVAWALRHAKAPADRHDAQIAPAEADAREPWTGVCARLFGAIVLAAGNAALLREHVGVTARLGVAWACEPELIQDGPVDIAELKDLFERRETPALVRASSRFHLKRIRLCVHISERAMSRSG